MAKTIVLAYSGGLDTSVATKWLQEERGYDVVCLTIDLGNLPDMDAARARGLAAGARAVDVIDAREDFLRFFAFPALAANAVYEGQYPLATALGRPLMAKLLVDHAREVGAAAVAHGCTGKGNDQVRFDVAIQALAPDLTIVGTARENLMTRDEAIAYAQQHDIPIRETLASPYSTDENLWGRSIECGILEDPWAEPPEDVYEWTQPLDRTPAEPLFVEIDFDHGVPVALDGEALDPVTLVDRLSRLGGEHGIGRIDVVENRLVGIKSREIYEAPAAVTLMEAHLALEALTLSKPQARMKERVAQEYADLNLQRPLVHRPPPGPGGVRAVHAAPRQRRGAHAALARHGGGDGAAVRPHPLQPRARHLRRRRPVRPERGGGLHQAVGAAGAAPGAAAAPARTRRPDAAGGAGGGVAVPTCYYPRPDAIIRRHSHRPVGAHGTRGRQIGIGCSPNWLRS